MARDHSRIKVSIWDGDFTNLRVDEQHAYLLFVSNPGLSRCGVLDWIPSRFLLASDLTPNRLKRAVAGLRNRDYIVLDDHTQELLVRSYVRHDGVLDRLNMGKATGSAFEAVVSKAIRDAIGEELARHMADKPDLEGWKGLGMTSPMAYAMALGTGGAKP